jgi:hypothetical protein
MTTEPKYPELDTVPNIEPLQKPSFKETLASYKTYWTTREGWIGDYVWNTYLIMMMLKKTL